MEEFLAFCLGPGPKVTVIMVPEDSHARALTRFALAVDVLHGRTYLLGPDRRVTMVPATTIQSSWDVCGGTPYRLALMLWEEADPKDMKGAAAWMDNAAQVCVMGGRFS